MTASAVASAVAFAAAAAAVAPALSQADLAAHRGAMLRFARRRMRDEDLAEDAVQDALLAALSSLGSFQGQSALRTWLIGILNHKIQDAFRREARYVPVADSARDDALPDEGLDRLAWGQSGQVGDTNDPAQYVASARLLDALLAEIDALPVTLREVFVLQVLEGRDTAQVCRRLGITEANCWVRLHRARKRLAGRMRDHLA
ncbi:MAG: sigma-70 family RNA polymerase sigma factor [Burkholderiaceae bacterium]|nr:sigma-70 family RNA polymerase sigma factor [Burkholderiaceae bacterium]MEB2350121.1 sigma-70 family RNA polymerase sigma factor [Burkholderiaceae bacterium]